MTALLDEENKIRHFGGDEALQQIENRLTAALEESRHEAKRWSRLAMWLPLAGGAGSAIAGAGVATENLDPVIRTVMVVVAFLGAAAAAAAAALKASERAKEAEERHWQLRSVAHWVRLIKVNLDPTSDGEKSDAEIMRRVVLVLARIDQIYGVSCAWSGAAPWELSDSGAEASMARGRSDPAV